MKTIIFDLDGTLADITYRLKYIEGDEKDWDAFFDAVGDDKPIEEIVTVCRALYGMQGVSVVIVTGRSEVCRSTTINWLVKNSIGCDHLYMRREGDHRPSHVFKAEILERLKAEGREIILVFEDRRWDAEMWRARGIRVAQVAVGDF